MPFIFQITPPQMRVVSVYLAMLKRGPQTLDKFNCPEWLGLASSLYFGSDSKWDQSLAGFAYEGGG